MAEVRMPKMGDGMEQGTINVWLKKEGDHVNSGEAIAEVETDKANVEIAAYETGVLSKIVVAEGKTVPVGELIAYIGDAALAAASAPAPAAQSPAAANGSSASAPPPAEAQKPAESAQPAAEGSPTTERLKASPLARKMADELKLDLARITGTGPGGRIKARDVEVFASSPAAATAPPAVSTEPKPAPVAPAAPVPVAAPVAAAQEIKVNNMRNAIARRTVQSKQNIPHFYVTMKVEMDRALALLKELNADATSGKITVNDIIIKASAVALQRVPEVNATWADGTIRRYSECHIGMAVGIEDGLIIPVIRNCESKTLRQISADAKSLGAKAKAGQLKPEDYSGGTFSTSNLGMMGVDEFIAIINPPEAAILAIGGIVREPVVAEKDQIVIRSNMKVTISADHRLLDGVVAARFLQEVKKSLEAPFGLLA
jgi:pyruvate dehydrogenase E2 component (dihydrolipoamide acetyltransferase)